MASPSAEDSEPDENPPRFRSSQDSPSIASAGQDIAATDAQSNIKHAESQDSDSASSYSDSSASSRPNRFQGPSSTWRAHASAEIALSASLDQQRAEDLGIHLYNTHHLKRRLRDPERVANAKPWQSKNSWIGRDAKRDLPWMPDATWTAWPLSASEVPRPREGFGSVGVDDHAMRRKEAWRPSGDLQEELLGIMLNKAKERFRQRKWEGESDARNDHRVGKAVKAELSRFAPETNDRAASSRFERTTHGKPNFLTDDDRARTLLGPDVRHILTRLDDLLLALHRSRAAQRRPRPVSASRSRSRSKSVARSRSRASSQDSQADVDARSESATVETVESRSRSRRRSSSARTPRHPLAPRDWSEVLGMAALIGWDHDVVSRAAKRCANLFGEGMVLRRMPETAVGKEEDEVVEYRPGLAPSLGESDEDVEEEEGEQEIERRLLCPFEECPRSQVVFAKGFRWREHLKRYHDLNAEDIATLEESLGLAKSEIAGSGSAPNPEETESEDEESGEEMEGAVHLDGFLQPFNGKLGRGKDVKERRRRRLTAGEEGAKGRKRAKVEPEESDAIGGADEVSSEENGSG